MDLLRAVDELGALAESWARVEAEVEETRRAVRAATHTLASLRRPQRSTRATPVAPIAPVSSHVEEDDVRVEEAIARARAALERASGSDAGFDHGSKSRASTAPRTHARTAVDLGRAVAEASSGGRGGGVGGRGRGCASARGVGGGGGDRRARGSAPSGCRPGPQGTSRTVGGRGDSIGSSGVRSSASGMRTASDSRKTAMERLSSALPAAARAREDPLRGTGPVGAAHQRREPPPDAASEQTSVAAGTPTVEAAETQGTPEVSTEFPRELRRLMRQHKDLISTATAAATSASSHVSEERDKFCAAVSPSLDITSATAELLEAYSRCVRLLKSLTQTEMELSVGGNVDPAMLVALCRMAAIHDTTLAQVGELDNAYDALARVVAKDSAARDMMARADPLASSAIAECKRALSRLAVAGDVVDALHPTRSRGHGIHGAEATSSAESDTITSMGRQSSSAGGPKDGVWLPLHEIGPGAAQLAEKVVSRAAAFGVADKWYSDLKDLIDATTLHHRLQAAVVELELEHRLTSILAQLVCSDVERDVAESVETERLFAEVYRAAVAMREGRALAFVRVDP